MVMVGFSEDDIMSQIDFDAFFGDLPNDLSLLGAGEFANPSPDSTPLTLYDLEDLLMNDEIDGDAAASETAAKDVSDGFLADLFVDFPSDGSCEVVDGSSDKESDSGVGDKPVEVAEAVDDSGNAVDPVDKKRQRQLRNRDAAVKSRERKKEYVKDLEAKSKYMEKECLRLGRLLQCLTAENQSLRFGLQNGNAYGVSMANQESAVLLLESLLLGSLFWFLGIIICLSTLPTLPRLTLEAENAGKTDPKSRTLKGARSETDKSSLLSFPFIGRSCKSSKTKMKAGVSVPGVSPSVI